PSLLPHSKSFHKPPLPFHLPKRNRSRKNQHRQPPRQRQRQLQLQPLSHPSFSIVPNRLALLENRSSPSTGAPATARRISIEASMPRMLLLLPPLQTNPTLRRKSLP